MFQSLKKALGLDPNDKALKRYAGLVEKINALEPEYETMDDESLAALGPAFRNRHVRGESLDDLLPEVFAVVREVSKRTLGMRHFDVQLMGGMALHEGRIAEMRTGEGKTLVATLAVALNALSGKGVHLVTVNDYLSRRDAEWMAPIYRFLGLEVACIYAFMDNEERMAAYRADITYGTNSEFGFDYLRDNMAISPEQLVQRGHNFCIVDEVDSILIDEARTPLIISGPSEDSVEPYQLADQAARKLQPERDFELDEKERNLALTEEGIARCQEILKLPELFSEMANSDLAHKVLQALKAHHLFQRDVHYVIKDGDVVIVDEFTGRLMFGRRFSEGLHQAIEAKEKVKIGSENQTLATVTLQNYFRMYGKLSGMTGTAATEAEEFKEIYGLEVIVVPTNKPTIRDDQADVIYRSQREKFAAVADEVAEIHAKGAPVLVGTTSIESSERVSKLLKARKIPHQVLNAKHHEQEAFIVAQAGARGAVTVATNMAGRGTDIVLGGNPEFLARQEAEKQGITAETDVPDYAVLLEKFREKCFVEKEEVLAQGGLHIVGTERHESRRIDNQLRGRSGRQGDPGASRFYLALEDDLLRLFGSERIQGIMEKLGLEEGEAIEHSIITRSIESAQKKVEQMHFDIRRQLLMYDNVMNQQREAVYTERRNTLEDGEIVEHTWGVIRSAADAILDRAFPENAEPEVHAAQVQLKQVFWPGLEKHIEGLDTKELLPPAREAVLAELRERFDAKVTELGEETCARLFRFLTLHVLDQQWKEHLLAMDELRRGIGLRAIGQKDPLVEYQFESHNLFEDMLSRVRQTVADMALKVSIVREEKVRPSRDLKEGRTLDIPAQTADQRAAARAGQGEKAKEPIRKGPKVGRNDPCPCGSGKKYKHCCGRNA